MFIHVDITTIAVIFVYYNLGSNVMYYPNQQHIEFTMQHLTQLI